MKDIIIKSYTFLCNNYSAESKDEIFLLGFSRGAFAVRCLADFIHRNNVLRKSELHELHRLYADWKNNIHQAQPATLGTEVSIKACAVWDTVSAVGLPLPRLTLWERLRFVNSEFCPSVEYFFQALALHEHRYHFFPIVLHVPPHKADQVEQRWFAGYHADIGGGNKSDALAHFALVWVMSKLDRWITFDTSGLGGLLPNTTWRVPGACYL